MRLGWRVILMTALLCGCTRKPWGPQPSNIRTDSQRAYVTVQLGHRTRLPYDEGVPDGGSTTTAQYLFTYSIAQPGPLATIESIRPEPITEDHFQYFEPSSEFPYPEAVRALSRIPNPDLPPDLLPLFARVEDGKTSVLAAQMPKKGNQWLVLDSSGGKHRADLPGRCRLCAWDVTQRRIVFFGGALEVRNPLSPLARSMPQEYIIAIWDYDKDGLTEKTLDIKGDLRRFVQAQ